MQLFGLDHRTFRELRQTHMGTSFFLQTLWTLACHIAYGGFFIEEHPGIIPRQPSIWRSAIIRVLRQHPDVHFHERLPSLFLRDLYQQADDAARRPTSHAIGVDADGNFRTSCHKEYPGRLSAGLANAIGSQLIRTLRDRLVRAIAEPPLPLAQFIRCEPRKYSYYQRCRNMVS